ncbi:MAG: M48 family metallopeptidase [Planctomycetes bacterium]|jgi:predicted metal-dependent hydrolase|nr:M48 family metallopeptidase [Planctomycetota bacterium]
MLKRIDTWQIPDIGPVAVETSDRARYTRITLKRSGEVKLTIPAMVSLDQARRFFDSRIAWIKRHRRDFRGLAEMPVAGWSEARDLLFDRLRELAARHGYQFNKATVKNQRTLWGSCSHRNNINLNVNLLRLPEELRDYVILHELVHTRHKNHSRAFWHELDGLVGDAKSLQRALRRFRLNA